MFPFDAKTDRAETQPIADAVFAYRMRWKRRRLLYRSWKRRNEITSVSRMKIPETGVLVFSTMRNEILRVGHWLKHYRALGAAHFLVVDNGSDDGTAEFLAQQPDVSLWTTTNSYRASRFGVDWLTCLQHRYGHGRWCLTVDADELLVYPDSDSRSLAELVSYLEKQGQASFGALLLDMYPKGSVAAGEATRASENPIETLNWFDADNYRAKIHPVFGNLWIQGGVRDRVFFGRQPDRSPTLNKTPLVKWKRGYVYVTSTHQILPRRLNDVFDLGKEPRVSGVLLHTKFLPNIGEKSAEELTRAQHFENSELYKPYYNALIDGPNLWFDRSVRFTGTEQLIDLGLMSQGNWR